jgi:hypothetical protein
MQSTKSFSKDNETEQFVVEVSILSMWDI